MSESISSPWIRDYLVDVAETHGAQLYNVPISTRKKRVQLTDFLTHQQDSYVWAWVSDKDNRVSVRISKDAADVFKSKHGRSIIDCRFSLVFIASYRPMFSPRPLGSNAPGNTRASHISLEVGYVSSIGTGAHLFGNPRDLESDQQLKDWVSGLRQDGGGGNILKLRKQQALAQNKKAPSCPPCPPPFSLHAPVSQGQTAKAVEDAVDPKPERPRDFKRTYTKRWRRIKVNPWKFATKPPAEEQQQEQPEVTTVDTPLVKAHLDVASRLESCDRRSLACLTPPRRTSSPASLQRQGTPSNWSPSNRGSPIPSDNAHLTASENGAQQDDKLDVLPIGSHPLSDTEGHATVDTAIVSDTHSLQPPTPAQRIKDSLLPCSSPETSIHSPILSFQQLPRSSPPPPSSSLPPPPSLPIPMGIRKNVQRKVPHPGLHAPRPDPANQDPIQILVPNSDTSGAGSSQSQPQQYQPRPLSHPPAFSSSFARELKPVDTSTPKDAKLGNSTRHTSKMLAESLATHDIDRQETTSTNGKCATERADTNLGEQEGSESTRPPAQSIAENAKGKGKARVIEESDTPSIKAGMKRQRSTQANSLAQKRAKASPREVHRSPSDGTDTRALHDEHQQDAEAPALGQTQLGNQLSTPPADTTEVVAPPLAPQLTAPRLANFVVDFGKIDLGKSVPIPRLDFEKDVKGTLLRTGRIRTLGEKVEKDGTVYTHL